MTVETGEETVFMAVCGVFCLFFTSLYDTRCVR